MKSTSVMLPVVFEEFEVAYIFFAIAFLFIIIVNLHKANFSKNLEGGWMGGWGCSPPSPPPSFYGPGFSKNAPSSMLDIVLNTPLHRMPI